MAVYSVRKSGLTMGVDSHVSARPNGRRGEILGWSMGAARRNTAWLQSVDFERLNLPNIVAVTLTLPSTPETAEEWTALRTAWFHRLRRRGVVGTHWVTEWTRRGRPHLHAAVILGETLTADDLVVEWLSVATAKGRPPMLRSQHVTPVHDVVGWLQYLAKHAARGVGHYQRMGKPQGWEKAGRLWGHTGEWPMVEEVKADFELDDFHRLRRLVRSARIAEARGREDWSGLARARRMLKCSKRHQSMVKGVSLWIDDQHAWTLVEHAQQVC